MTEERRRAMLEYYCPHERDETLDEGEYYCRDSAGRVQRVRPVSIYPGGMNDGLIYECVYADSGKRFHGDYGREPFSGVMRGQLYDNAEDCRNGTHDIIDDWEKLRKPGS